MFRKTLLYLLLGLSVLSVVFYSLGVVSEDVLLYWNYILLAVTIVLAIALPIADLIKDPKKLMKFFGLVIVTAILVAVSYAFSTTEVHNLNKELAAHTSAATIKWTDAGLYCLYVLMGLTVIAILYSEIKNALK